MSSIIVLDSSDEDESPKAKRPKISKSKLLAPTSAGPPIPLAIVTAAPAVSKLAGTQQHTANFTVPATLSTSAASPTTTSKLPTLTTTAATAKPATITVKPNTGAAVAARLAATKSTITVKPIPGTNTGAAKHVPNALRPIPINSKATPTNVLISKHPTVTLKPANTIPRLTPTTLQAKSLPISAKSTTISASIPNPRTNAALSLPPSTTVTITTPSAAAGAGAGQQPQVKTRYADATITSVPQRGSPVHARSRNSSNTSDNNSKPIMIKPQSVSIPKINPGFGFNSDDRQAAVLQKQHPTAPHPQLHQRHQQLVTSQPQPAPYSHLPASTHKALSIKTNSPATAKDSAGAYLQQHLAVKSTAASNAAPIRKRKATAPPTPVAPAATNQSANSLGLPFSTQLTPLPASAPSSVAKPQARPSMNNFNVSPQSAAVTPTTAASMYSMMSNMQSFTASATPPLRLLATPPHTADALNDPFMLNPPMLGLPPTTMITPQQMIVPTPSMNYKSTVPNMSRHAPVASSPPVPRTTPPLISPKSDSNTGVGGNVHAKPQTSVRRIKPTTLLKKSDEAWLQHMQQLPNSSSSSPTLTVTPTPTPPPVPVSQLAANKMTQRLLLSPGEVATTAVKVSQQQQQQRRRQMSPITIASSPAKSPRSLLAPCTSESASTIVVDESPSMAQPKLNGEGKPSLNKTQQDNVSGKEEELEPIEPEFEELLKICGEMDQSVEMQVRILTKLKRYYHSVHAEFVRSRGFRKILRLCIDRIRDNPGLIYYHLRSVFDELKARRISKSVTITVTDNNDDASTPTNNVAAVADRGNNPNNSNNNTSPDTSTVSFNSVELTHAMATSTTEATTSTSQAVASPASTGNKRTDEQIHKLNHALHILTKRIEKLDEAEVNLEDEDSAYLQVERYKKRACQIYEKICDLTGECKNASRLAKKPIHFNATDFPQFNKTIQAFINRTKEFPDYYDVLRMLEHCNEQYAMGLASFEMKRIAHDAFSKVGKLLQRRRKTDLYETVTHFTGNAKDPASTDPLLLAKLNENKKHQTKISDILEKYARDQDLTAEEQKEARLKQKLKSEMDKNNETDLNEQSEGDMDNEESKMKSNVKDSVIITTIVDDEEDDDDDEEEEEEEDDDDDDDDGEGEIDLDAQVEKLTNGHLSDVDSDIELQEIPPKSAAKEEISAHGPATAAKVINKTKDDTIKQINDVILVVDGKSTTTIVVNKRPNEEQLAQNIKTVNNNIMRVKTGNDRTTTAATAIATANELVPNGKVKQQVMLSKTTATTTTTATASALTTTTTPTPSTVKAKTSSTTIASLSSPTIVKAVGVGATTITGRPATMIKKMVTSSKLPPVKSQTNDASVAAAASAAVARLPSSLKIVSVSSLNARVIDGNQKNCEKAAITTTKPATISPITATAASTLTIASTAIDKTTSPQTAPQIQQPQQKQHRKTSQLLQQQAQLRTVAEIVISDEES